MGGRSFSKLLGAKEPKTLLCIGLDTDPGKIPPGVDIYEFNEAVIAATKNLVCAYKFNLKFYLAEMHKGLSALEQSVTFARRAAPGVITILDSKDGDVGASAAKAAEFAFDKLGVDAVTVNPWGGYEDGLDAFFKYKNKGIFVWCMGSNKGYRDFQRRERSGMVAAIKAAREWNSNGNAGIIIGATRAEEFENARKWAGDVPILVPGIGAQGGDLASAVRRGVNSNGGGLIFNASRSVIYKSNGPDFAGAAREEAACLKDQINKHRRFSGS